MAGGKETPRQSMIGILYLVLLGLVALNVPDSLLDAFKNISDSLHLSKVNVAASIHNTFAAFEATKLKEQPERAKPIYEKARQASKIASELDAYIASLKKLLIEEGGGYDPSIGDYKGRADLDISARLMINQKRAIQLRDKINQTKQQLLALLDPKDREGINFSLQANDPPKRAGLKKTWQEATFGDGIPLGAALTALTKIQSDVKNAESEVVKKILGKMEQAVVNLDQFAAVAVAPTSYLIQGQPYKAEVFLTASDSKATPTITVGGVRLPTENGKGVYTVHTNSEGIFKWVGSIKVQQNDGTIKEYKTPEQMYQVSKPSAVVSPDKMNVFYIGVPNPISISAPGIAVDKLQVSMTGGVIGGSGGHYVAKVSTAGKALVTVATDISGKRQVLAATEFRVKRIPDPKARFAGKSTGVMNAVQIKSQNKVFAILDNFDFDAKFDVTRFTLLVQKPRQDPIILQGDGSTLTPAMRTAMGNVVAGSRVIFDNIIAVGPDGAQRGLDPIVITVN